MDLKKKETSVTVKILFKGFFVFLGSERPALDWGRAYQGSQFLHSGRGESASQTQGVS